MTHRHKLLNLTIVIAVLAVFWELLSVWLGANAVAPPIPTLGRLWTLAETKDFWRSVVETGRAVFVSALLTTIGGVLLGLVLGLRRFAGQVASPILVALYALPKVALYPIVLMLFGLSFKGKVSLGILNGFAPIVIVTMEAVGAISPIVLRTAKSLHLTPREILFEILMPAALPEILGGIRIGVSLVIVGVLIGEIFASNLGIGFSLTNASQLNDNLTVTALTLFIVMFALFFNGLLGLAFRRRASRTI